MKSIVFIILISFLALNTVSAKVIKKKVVKYRDKQNISFDGLDLEGEARSPDGQYLLQKSGVDFVPLYKVKNSLKSEISEMIYLLQ